MVNSGIDSFMISCEESGFFFASFLDSLVLQEFLRKELKMKVHETSNYSVAAEKQTLEWLHR